MRDNSWIEGKVALVTGGGSGIGQAIAVEAAARGAIVVIADIDKEGGEETAKSMIGDGGTAYFHPTDVTEAAAVGQLVTQAQSYGKITFLANSAGLQTYGTVESTSEEAWDKTIDVNLKSMFLMGKAVVPIMKANGRGAIVNISSIQGMRCQKNVLAYATSKGAVIAMTRAMGLDHAKEGIGTNCICPGSIDTPMLRYGAGKHGEVEEVLNTWAAHHPIGRIGTAQEIAKTTMFLWSPEASFIVGQAIVADGGLGSVIL